MRAGYGGKGQNRKSAREAASRLRAMPEIANAIAKVLERKPGLTRTMEHPLPAVNLAAEPWAVMLSL